MSCEVKYRAVCSNAERVEAANKMMILLMQQNEEFCCLNLVIKRATEQVLLGTMNAFEWNKTFEREFNAAKGNA
jgi:hypothetical protein